MQYSNEVAACQRVRKNSHQRPVKCSMTHPSANRLSTADCRQSIDSQRSGKAPARVQSHPRCHQNSTLFEKRQARDLSNCWCLCVINFDLCDVLVCVLAAGLRTTASSSTRKLYCAKRRQPGRFSRAICFRIENSLATLQDCKTGSLNRFRQVPPEFAKAHGRRPTADDASISARGF